MNPHEKSPAHRQTISLQTMPHPLLEKRDTKKAKSHTRAFPAFSSFFQSTSVGLLRVLVAISNSGTRHAHSHSLKATLNLTNWIAVTCMVFTLPFIGLFFESGYTGLFFMIIAVCLLALLLIHQGFHRAARLFLVHGVPLGIFIATLMVRESSSTKDLSTQVLIISALIIPLVVFRTSELFYIIEGAFFICLLLFLVGYKAEFFPYKPFLNRDVNFLLVQKVSVVESVLFVMVAFGYYKFLIDRSDNQVRCLVRDLRVQNEMTRQANEELKTSEQQLTELNEAKNKLFSIIAHDLRSPMNSFKGFSGLLINNIDSLSKEDVQVLVKGMGKSFNNVNTLLENLLQWSRVQMNTLSYQPEVIDLSVLISDNLNLVEPMAADKEITVRSHVHDNLYALADKNVFNVVLRNLLTNAVKFTHANGAIEVRASRDSGNIRIEVTDNGIGMNPATLENLFTSQDYHYSSLGTANERGTGLGLMLCKEFVEKWHGKIGATSVKGQGSTFYFTIPSYQDPLFSDGNRLH